VAEKKPTEGSRKITMPKSDEDIARDIIRAVTEGTKPGREVDRFDPLRREDWRQDIRLKRFYGYFLPSAMAAQLLIADTGFFLYAWLGRDWNVAPTIMHVWLGATVIEVVGIVLVVTQYLFPRRDSTR
jgi:hypothetical protein